MAGPTTPRSIEKTKKRGIEAPLLLVMAGPVVPISIEKKQKREAEIRRLLALAGPIVLRSIGKNKKEKEKRGSQSSPTSIGNGRPIYV